MKFTIFFIIFAVGIRFYDISIYGKWDPNPNTVLGKIKSISKIFIEYKGIIYFFALFGLLNVISNIYSKNRVINYILLFVSIVMALRFLLKIINELEFNSFMDMGVSLIFIFIMLGYLDTKINFAEKLNQLFLLPTESYIFQLFAFHLTLLLIILIFFISIVMIIVGVNLGIAYLYKPMLRSEINLIKNIIFVVKGIGIKLVKFLDKYFEFNLKSIYTNYINPFNGISHTPIYKNMHLIKVAIVFIYIITGIIIIYYWGDLTYVIYNSKEIIGQNFNFISKELYELKIPSKNFEDYRLIFIIPLISIFFSNWLKKK
ncbi:MAG: hypothetical protein E6441_12410 [Clostridium sp.]|uniref:hypothetical protein n=1 Tax=Clostridium sp. TaxID=1506 RepID=UPI00290A1D25|nr:hypothetical protein [Clostridium sp.]MDU5211479.1 hypothetical protein [Clostridium sp.]MDU6762259.1 hypothetical protein [Clostridium sp.]